MFLGPTESRVMELLWKHRQLTVKQVLVYLGPKSSSSHSTIATILSRLTERGLLKTEKSGRHFIFSPTVTRAEFIRERLSRVRACLKRNLSSQ